MERGGQTYYYHTNALGSVSAVTDSTGAVVERYSYTAYGQMSIADGQGNPLSSTAIGNPYGFTGRRYDEETGLWYYRNRYYNSATGRFISRDLLGYIAGINLYEYVKSSPIKFIDPKGKEQQADDEEFDPNEHPWPDEGDVIIDFIEKDRKPYIIVDDSSKMTTSDIAESKYLVLETTEDREKGTITIRIQVSRRINGQLVNHWKSLTTKINLKTNEETKHRIYLDIAYMLDHEKVHDEQLRRRLTRYMNALTRRALRIYERRLRREKDTYEVFIHRLAEHFVGYITKEIREGDPRLEAEANQMAESEQKKRREEQRRREQEQQNQMQNQMPR